ncbi:hypothetical protein NRIC_26260 [Enterococcus florum]|uniref:WxL domain-containing protein n=1 Tax=Enterococcus florum TaxID=2480627 RepID=A0A4P5P9H4_9ENTE|nr:hypothetical protein [Enterococcus florum]GCF94735.1 hypothetical protein NRIC_26260 [Enterococcus florum]
MKKVLVMLLATGIALSAAPLAFAADGTETGSQQPVNSQSTADIEVYGTLGADNTDPEANIPEEDVNWINVTVPTKTIFYNTASDKSIKAPTYSIVNNSGRPVTVTANGFTENGSNPTLPSDFNLNLDVKGSAGNLPTTASTNLVTNGSLATPLNAELITLANNKNQMVATEPETTPENNQATFTYSGDATATAQMQLAYTLSLKFDAVKWN